MQRSKLHVSIRNPQSRYSDEKGDETKTLLEAVNKALGELAEEGTLTELSEKYFGTDISKEAAE